MTCKYCDIVMDLKEDGVHTCKSCLHVETPFKNAGVKTNDAGEKLQSTEQTLKERGNRYGEFKTHALLSQNLKLMFHDHVNKYGRPQDFTWEMSEAIDMIFHKLARIANGDPTYDDNYRDIAGFAQLVVHELNKN